MAGFPQNENGIKDHEQNILTKGKERERKRDNYSSARETEEDLSMGQRERDRVIPSVSQSRVNLLPNPIFRGWRRERTEGRTSTY